MIMSTYQAKDTGLVQRKLSYELVKRLSYKNCFYFRLVLVYKGKAPSSATDDNQMPNVLVVSSV